MKVFISHSSKDKWAARRISEDLVGLGATTFLDEKDIQTGQPIDGSVHKQLRDSEDFLILLSPASMHSEWVLIELGGALALGKHVVPILLYVGVNDVPKAISLHLARDINEIALYYDELKARLAAPAKKLPTTQTRKSVGSPKRRISFKKGDVVKLPASRQPELLRDTILVDWRDEMTDYCGRVATITEVGKDRIVRLDVDNGKWWWAFEWLSKVTEP